MLSALVYAALAAFGDAQAVLSAVRTFPIPALAWMIALTLACYFIRALRWRYLLRVTGHRLGLSDSVYIQLSGMTMTVTPGKAGEVLKAFLAREIADVPMGTGIALVFSERLSDVVAVTALSVGAIGVFSGAEYALGIAAVVLIAGIVVLGSKRAHNFVLTLLSRQSWLREHQDSVGAVSDAIRVAMALRVLALSVGLSALAWASEGIAFAICLRTFGFDGLSVPASVAVYTISTLLGALTFLPGGIGLTEASLAGLLVTSGMSAQDAAAATVLTRVVTLWFGVALGWTVLATRPAMLRALVRLGSEREGETVS